MIDHVGIYGSRVAEGLSAFNVGLVNKYWCHIFQIDYELDVIGFSTRDYSGIFN